MMQSSASSARAKWEQQWQEESDAHWYSLDGRNDTWWQADDWKTTNDDNGKSEPRGHAWHAGQATVFCRRAPTIIAALRVLRAECHLEAWH